MNHIVFDLELNSAFNAGAKPGVLINRNCPNEIIEIGAVKIDDQLEIVDKFQSLIRPTLYKKLSPIVQRKTKITHKEIYSGERFSTVYRNFRKWIGEDSYTLYAWGHSDIVDLRRSCKCHYIKISNIGHFVDLQKEFNLKYELGKGVNYSLKNALEFLEIRTDEEFHRALADAEYTAEIFIKMNRSV